MGSNETRKAFLRAAFRRRAAVVAAAARGLPRLDDAADADGSAAHRRHGDVRRVPGQDRSDAPRRDHCRGKRPILKGKVCAQAVDAGFCIDEPKKPLRCLPSFIVAGAQKAATGWLRQRLAAHPSLAQGGGKEVHYFDKLQNLHEWRSTYLDNFATPSAVDHVREDAGLPAERDGSQKYIQFDPVRVLNLHAARPFVQSLLAYQHHCRKGRFYAGPPSPSRRT